MPPLPPTIEQFTSWLRPTLSLTNKTRVTADTRLEDDLGVTGDDGVDLLLAVEKKYGISLEPLRQTFNMQPNEYLFHGEGFGIDFLALFRLRDEPKPVVRVFRVGELYDAVCRLMSEANQHHSS